ncbi:MAG: TAG lipase/steryl ester hydrolase/phospholipase A2/LPA acyltransferase [Glaciecola sp.]|jgi:predicted acylesterase/phospholipase RssA
MANKRLSELENVMKTAECYADYKDAAHAHDELSGASEWKAKDACKDYDYREIRKRVQRIKQAKLSNDATGLMYILHEGLHGNLGNIAASSLNCHAKIGTKHLIEEFIKQVCESLDFIYQADENEIDFYEKLSFFDETAHAFGSSCLMLSGGAGLGFFHGGVIRCLVEHDLLPDVISGASAGAIIAALVGTSTNDELKHILTPDVIYAKFREWRLWNGFSKNSLFDSTNLENALIELFDVTTFEEAYKKTGRHVTITVSPAELHQHSRLLNAKTSPNAIISQAVRASCAIPIVFSAVQLKAKDQAGDIVPYIPNRRFADGSIMADLPFKRLARLYGVNHSIVSQTNPISTLFRARDKRDTSGFLGLSLRHAAKLAKINSIYAFDMLESAINNRATKLGIHKIRSIIDQQYVGDINILPDPTLANFLHIGSNPSKQSLDELFKHGERTTWPQIDLIERNTIISTTLRKYLKLLKEREALILGRHHELKVVNS